METKMINKMELLTEAQKHAFDCMSNKKNVFLTCRAGGGKSFLIKLFRDMFQFDKTIAMTSTTGTSALLIGGTTIHSYLGIGLGDDDVDTLKLKITRNKFIFNRWLMLDVLIIDEISMLTPELFDKLELLARLIRGKKKPFGGIQLILTGDGLQLPCIGSEELFFQAKSWNDCIDHTIYLTEIFRQRDPKFQKCLNEVRMAELSDESIKLLESRVGVELTNEFNIKPTVIYSKNYKVDEINNRELDKLASDDNVFYEYEMEYTFSKAVTNKQLTIDIFKKNCIAPQILQICVGAQVMLLKNTDLESGLANGSRGIVTKFEYDMPYVKFLNGKEVLLDYDFWTVKEGRNVVLQGKQIPLKLAYASSIHKIQGATFDYCVMDISDVFEYGQAYVALSRVTDLKGLSIIGLDISRIVAHPVAKEYYKSLVGGAPPTTPLEKSPSVIEKSPSVIEKSPSVIENKISGKSSISSENSSSSRCIYILTRGFNQGTSCQLKTLEDSNYCKKHIDKDINPLSSGVVGGAPPTTMLI